MSFSSELNLMMTTLLTKCFWALWQDFFLEVWTALLQVSPAFLDFCVVQGANLASAIYWMSSSW
jgi:hypothetical protein